MNLKDFISEHLDRNLLEIIANLQQKIIIAERIKDFEFAQKLKELAFFINVGQKPAGVDENDYQLYYPLIERLVNKGQLKAEILKYFN